MFTFDALANRWLAAYSAQNHAPCWHAAQARYLRNDILPVLGGRPAEDVKRSEVALLRTRFVEQGQKVKANHVLILIRGIYKWAIDAGYVGDECRNPASDLSRQKIAKKKRSLSEVELRLVWHSADPNAFGDYARIVRLLALTGCRRTEIGALRWSEINLEKRRIELPSERTKNRHPHNVHLTDAALALLPSPRDGFPHLFGRRRDHVGFNGWSTGDRLFKAKIGGMAPWTLHDLRHTFTTHMNERGGALPHIVEACCNRVGGHKEGVAATYNHAIYAEQTRAAFEAWSTELQRIVSS